MSEELPCLTRINGAIQLRIKVQPRAGKNEIRDVLGGELRIRVTAPPVDSAANEAVVKLLSRTFRCPKRSIQIVHGKTSRHKTLRLDGVEFEILAAIIAQHL